MTFGFFILGVIIMAIGVLATWKTTYFLQNFGDISEVFGAMNARWLSWKLVGIFFIILGFLIAFDLFPLFVMLTIGRFFAPNG